MAITLNGTTGITTPAVTNEGAYTGDGVVFADSTPSNTLVTNTSGNIGVGTSSPVGKLEVVGTAYISSASSNQQQLALYANSTASYVTSTYQGSGSYKPLAFEVAGSERMRIDSSGNLLVGTTVTSASSGGVAILPQNGNAALVVGHASGVASGEWFVGFRYNGTGIGNISQNGTTAVSYNTSSDYRLKENIAPMTGALNKVQALKPVTYTWKADGSDGQGFIAHELQAVVPDCVTGEKDAVDEEGKPVYQGIDTSFLVATLTCAIQELKAIVDAQAERISVLENNNVGN